MAAFDVFCFSEGPLADGVPISMSRYGIPGEDAMANLDVRTHARTDDPDWFANWHTGALGNIASSDLGSVAGKLESSGYCHSVRIQRKDPPDLSHLQVGWAVSKWLVERGCFALLDMHQGRWLRASELAALVPERPFDLGFEIRVIFETEPDPTEGGHLVHTRGMAKFARPDLMVPGVPQSKAQRAGDVLRAIAEQLAQGRVMRAGETVAIKGASSILLDAYRPGKNAPEVNLNNDGLLVRLP